MHQRYGSSLSRSSRINAVESTGEYGLIARRRSISASTSALDGFTSFRSASRATSFSEVPALAAFSLRRRATSSSTFRTRISTISTPGSALSITTPATVPHLANRGRAVEIRRPIHLANPVDLGPDFLGGRLRGFTQRAAGEVLERAAARLGLGLQPPDHVVLELPDQYLSQGHLLLSL